MGKADLHIHTRHSDGFPTVDQLIDHVEANTCLDVIAVTDHEDVTGGLRARESAARKGSRVDVVPGVEVTTIHGHLLALFVEQTPPMFRSVESTLETIHSWGGLAVVPHPMSWLTRSISRRTIDRIVSGNEEGISFDAIETCNPSPAGKAVARKTGALNRRWRIPATGGSDAHHLLQVGCGWTEFAGSDGSALRTALESGGVTAGMSQYPSLRKIGVGRVALGLAWGYAATPRKLTARAISAVRWRR